MANRCWRAWPTACSPRLPDVLNGPNGWATRCAPSSLARQPFALCGRTGPLRLLVVGGSLGAGAQRHRAAGPGADARWTSAPSSPTRAAPNRSTQLRANYEAAGVRPNCPFIDDTGAGALPMPTW